MISDALLGAAVGAVATLGTQGIASFIGLSQSRDQDRRQIEATALVNQDDFEHFQAMLLRALDRGRWWYSWEQSDPQATVDDRKTLWTALSDKPAECAANAQGWLDYLKGQRLAVCSNGTRGAPEGQAVAPPVTTAHRTRVEHVPELTDAQAEIIRNTFILLEKARYAISLLTKRKFEPFAGLRVTATLEHHNSLADLGLGSIDYENFEASFATDSPAP